MGGHYQIISSMTILLKLAIVLLAFISKTITSPSCGLYGAPPCQFLPAPPGHTPACARPGKTYCEHVDNYPTYLIKHLVHKWGYESKNLIIDETWEEFESLKHHDISHFYDPAVIFNHQNNLGPINFNGYKYSSPLQNTQLQQSNNFNNHNSPSNHYAAEPTTIYIPKSQTQESNYLIYSSVTPQNHNKIKQNPNYHNNYETKVTQNNPTIWLKRYVRDLSEKSQTTAIDKHRNFDVNNNDDNNNYNSRDVSINLDLLDIVGVQKHRTKRQSPGRSTLCETTNNFIMPQAALNSRGNWMFVVNEQKTARQLVKTELCASTTCSNLCQLPNGYTSRCEQKFVQKRLIALHGTGQNLYTDTFWFPSCCVCTISNVN